MRICYFSLTVQSVPYNLNLARGVYDKMMMTILGHVKPNAKMWARIRISWTFELLVALQTHSYAGCFWGFYMTDQHDHSNTRCPRMFFLWICQVDQSHSDSTIIRFFWMSFHFCSLKSQICILSRKNSAKEMHFHAMMLAPLYFTKRDGIFRGVQSISFSSAFSKKPNG